GGVPSSPRISTIVPSRSDSLTCAPWTMIRSPTDAMVDTSFAVPPSCHDRGTSMCSAGRARRASGGVSVSEAVVFDVGGTEVTVSNPQRIYFSQRGETKLDLVRYYQAVAEPLLATLRGRPLLLERYPQGAEGKSWFQKRVPASVP